MDRGAWWAAVHGVAKSQTRLSDFTFTFHFHALEKEMATHSSVLAWSIPGTGEPGGLPSMGSHRVRHDWSNLAVAEAESFRLKAGQKFETCLLAELSIPLSGPHWGAPRVWRWRGAGALWNEILSPAGSDLHSLTMAAHLSELTIWPFPTAHNPRLRCRPEICSDLNKEGLLQLCESACCSICWRCSLPNLLSFHTWKTLIQLSSLSSWADSLVIPHIKLLQTVALDSNLYYQTLCIISFKIIFITCIDILSKSCWEQSMIEINLASFCGPNMYVYSDCIISLILFSISLNTYTCLYCLLFFNFYFILEYSWLTMMWYTAITVYYSRSLLVIHLTIAVYHIIVNQLYSNIK